MKEQFNTACGICEKEFKKPQYPEQAPTPPGVKQVVICEPCFQEEEKKGEGKNIFNG